MKDNNLPRWRGCADRSECGQIAEQRFSKTANLLFCFRR
jgi:hypothetical protein